ncbi:oxygenase MpaB family protein [Actinokineospora pegani]|uniref:oxygenase MpaB family protein n=1 Tax=Actinokineospora pegani TaxID=2654637 RepID=UPI0012EA3518|nr:oxygenase MpaB family protein [Actinokineospora pegani]
MSAEPTTRTPPTRFREAEARGRRLGRALRVLGRVPAEADEALLARLGAALLERDEPGAALAEAMRTRVVSRADLGAALAGDLPADAAPALADFVAEISAVPDWVDWDKVDHGTRVFTRLGRTAADVLLQLSLIGGYRFGGPTDLLVRTGALTGGQTLRRLGETQRWALSLSSARALRPGGEGWRLTAHVRAMHALVNAAVEPTWDVERWGLPINQADQAGTLGLFDGVLLIGCRALGVRIPAADAHAVMHLWRYVGWLLGVHPDFLTDDEHERHRINYHVLLAAPGLSPGSGPALAQAAVGAQAERFGRVRGWVERERVLSMLTGFLGARGMREFGLPVRVPWAFGYLLPLNLVRYGVLGRTGWGKRWLEASGGRVRDRVVASHFVGVEQGVAELPD